MPFRSLLHRCLAQLRPLRGSADASGHWLQLLRPELRAAPVGLRPWLEPIVALAGLVALLGLVGAGGLSLMLTLGTLALALMILTQVFGIQLDLQA